MKIVELIGGREVSVLMVDVLKENHMIIVEVPWVSLVNTPSPMITFASILDIFAMMIEVRTSSETQSVCETSSGVTVVFSGVDTFEGSP